MLAKAPSPHLSLVSGSSTPQLLTVSLGSLVEHYATNFRGKTAAVFTWQNHRLTYDDLARRSRIVAKSMLASGLQHGDCVAIMAGNCYQYIETFLAAARIGCPFVVLNNTYSPRELTTAIAATCKPTNLFMISMTDKQIACKMLFLASNIGPKDMSAHLKTVNKSPGQLEHLIHLSDHAVTTSKGVRSRSYSAFTLEGQVVGNFVLQEAESGVSSSDVLNLQFTSGKRVCEWPACKANQDLGTTGAPKAAMLTHS